MGTSEKDAFGVVEIKVTVDDGELNSTTSFTVTVEDVSDNIVVPYQEGGDDVNSIFFNRKS